MPTLYVMQPDARIEKEYERILVTREDEVIMRVPIQNVSGVVLAGSAGATTQALHALLSHNIPLFLVKYNGEMLGRLSPPAGGNLPLRQAQFHRNDETEFTLAFAQEIIVGKLHNQSVLAARIARRAPQTDLAPQIIRLRQAQESARKCDSLDSLLGIEGSAAAAYFDVLGAGFGTAWQFEKRTRRPPQDPVNALLSLGYTFLGYSMMAALEIVGLDPYLGYFHRDVYNRPALALDMIEEFRAPLADSLALGLLKRRLLQEQDFVKDETDGGIRLTPRGLRIFFREFSDKLESRVTLRRVGRPLSYRKLMELQARQLANVILGKAEKYQPFIAR